MLELIIDKMRLSSYLGGGADGQVNEYGGGYNGSRAVVKRIEDCNTFEDELRYLKLLKGVKGVVKCYGYDSKNRLLLLEYLGTTFTDYAHRINDDDKYKMHVGILLNNIYNIIESIINLGVMPYDVHTSNIMYDKDTGEVHLIDLARYRPISENYDLDYCLKFLYGFMSSGLIKYEEYSYWCKRYDSIILSKLEESKGEEELCKL